MLLGGLSVYCSHQYKQSCEIVQFQEVAACTLTGTVMLNLILLASLNEFPSYKKPVLSKRDSIVVCCLCVRARASHLNTTKGSPWQQTRTMSWPRVIANTSFHLRYTKLCITLQNAVMRSCTICITLQNALIRSCVIYLVLQMHFTFLHIWCASSHTT